MAEQPRPSSTLRSLVVAERAILANLQRPRRLTLPQGSVVQAAKSIAASVNVAKAAKASFVAHRRQSQADAMKQLVHSTRTLKQEVAEGLERMRQTLRDVEQHVDAAVQRDASSCEQRHRTRARRQPRRRRPSTAARRAAGCRSGQDPGEPPGVDEDGCRTPLSGRAAI